MTDANFQRIGIRTGLVNGLNKNPSNPVPNSEKVVATMVEAILGAVVLDGGPEAVPKVMQTVGIISVTPVASLEALEGM